MADAASSAAARPPVLALDLGASWLRAAVVTGDGAVHARTVAPTPTAEGREAVVTACIRALRAAAAAFAAAEPSGPRPAAVGVCAPGPVDPFRGVVVDPPNMGAGFRDVPLAAEIAAALDLPSWLDRDTQAAALGEGAFGAARGCRDFVYLTVSTGVGGAIVSDGRLLRGPDGAAGELGHLLVDRDGPPCGCGSAGHLEAFASGTGMAATARRAVAAGHRGPLADIVRREGPALAGRHVDEAARAGDQAAQRILDDARDALAAACVSIVDVFDPELLVIGGGVARGQGEAWLEAIRSAVERTAFRLQAARVGIVPAALGDDVGLIGAAELATGGAAQDRIRPGSSAA